MFISEILFRESCDNPQQCQITNCEIRLSSTLRNENNLSSAFAENIGEDETLVAKLPKLVVGTSNPASRCPLPKSFGDVIVLNKPFLYDPRVGNLLMDIKHDDVLLYPGGLPARFETNLSSDDGVARIASISATNEVADIADTDGLVVAFVLCPIPRLQTALDKNSLILTWIANPKSILQTSPNVGDHANWIAFPSAPGSVVIENYEYNRIIISRQSADIERPLFFRLLVQQ